MFKMTRRVTRATAETSDVSSHVANSNQIGCGSLQYLNNQYDHPAFNKLFLGSNVSRASKNGNRVNSSSKPKAPEKPLVPYVKYSRKVWDNVKTSQPDLKFWQMGKVIGKMWRDLPAVDKQTFIEEHEAEKADYQEQLRSYHNSPAYQNYLQAKGKADAIESDNISYENDELSIEPAEDSSSDADKGFSVKHVAAARFSRNHRLMQDVILESSVVPTGIAVVTEQRLEMLKSQVQTLAEHQKNLQQDITEIEKQHNLTKRKWKESSVAFTTEIKRLCSSFSI